MAAKTGVGRAAKTASRRDHLYRGRVSAAPPPEHASARPSYDPQVVARDAMSKDPGLDAGLALRLAREAGDLLAVMSDWDAPELSRRLLAGSPETGATPANCVATAAIAHVRETGIRFSR